MTALSPRLGAIASLAVAALLPAPAPAADQPVGVHHDLTVRVEPATHRIEVTDRITFPGPSDPVPDDGGALLFHLHGNLDVKAMGEGYTVRESEDVEATETGSVPLRTWELRREGPVRETTGIVLRLTGTIHHPLVSEGEEYARSFARSPGLITEEGVVLSGGTRWLPAFGDMLLTFKMTVDLPEGWDSVSQGRRTSHEVKDGRRIATWDCAHPMEEVYLIAARFTEYERTTGDVTAYAFLRTPDPALAAKYLEVTAQYIEMYRRLIGRYPFAKFALVENFWETGYGMPSFTLLGQKIIRFPFILHSSYPHEILHNWWGNSVYVDWQTGNWCEGLTAYLADHLIKEGHGRGAEYRRDTLKKYRAYAGDGRDFPLREFRSRHSGATEAIGYGKSLMLWHMVRVRIGDDLFRKGLQVFYRRYRYGQARFEDLGTCFSEVSGEDLSGMFAQWVERTGAPELTVEAALIGGGVRVVVRQVQETGPYDLTVPVAITLAGVEAAEVLHLAVGSREDVFELEFAADVLRVDLDPRFDVFRRLDREEIPPTLGDLFGSQKVLIVTPGKADPLHQDWVGLAEAWKGPGVDIISADELSILPTGRAVWLLGSANPMATRAVRDRIIQYGAEVTDDTVKFGATSVTRAGHGFILVTRRVSDPDMVVGWIGSDTPASFPGLARKLPHYGKYSYLAFDGDEPTNVQKGTWPASGSPLTAVPAHVRELPAMGALPAEVPLERLAPVFDGARMMEDVRWMADDAREGRGIGTQGLDDTAEWLAEQFEAAGLQPGGAWGSWFQTWEEKDGPDGKPVTLRNVVGVLPGHRDDWKAQSVVVGAHYDHLGRGWPDVRTGNEGLVHNGADDNASGVAVMLEVARLMAESGAPDRTIVFVAFSGEEWGLRGSRYYAGDTLDSAWPAKGATSMINLDTVGRLGDGKLLMLGGGTATEWRHIAMGVGYTTGVEATCVTDDPGGSDQVSFHGIGVPAVQLFTGPSDDYHRPSDDVEDIDADGMVKVATFLRESIGYLSARPEPLTSTLGGGAGTKPVRPHGGGGRKVSLGTMPDFAFPGPGIKVASVLPGTPAEAAGIQEGDIVLAIDGTELADLRAYSQALKARAPGDVVTIRLRRGEEEIITVKATLVAR